MLVVPLGGEEQGRDVEEALRRAWRRLVALLAGERPVVIGIDDAHWADDGLLDLVEDVALGLDDAPLLVLCTSRPELVERRPGFGGGAPNVTRIELRPLAEEASAELSAALLGERSGELASRVAATSGGNPFFAEEITRRIVDDPDAALSADLPETVQAAIAARLDLLPRGEKRAIQHAAVLGQAFTGEALSELVGEPVAESLDGLVRKALVQERLADGPGRYTFRHQLICDVAYGSLPRAERARLHERAAATIVVGVHPELAELAAFHRVRAAELEPSAEREDAAYEAVAGAAEVVARRGASLRAQHLYEQAAKLARSAPESLHCLGAAADVALRQFRGDEAFRLVREQAAAAEAAGERAVAAAGFARAVELPTRMAGVTGRVPEAEMREMLERGLDLVEPDDDVTLARLLLGEAWIAWRADRLAEMEEPVKRALEMARRSGDAALISNALDAASTMPFYEGRFEAVAANNRERLELLDRASSQSLEVEYERSDAFHMVIASLAQTGEFREAAAYGAEAREADLARGVEHAAWERALVPLFFLGEWDEALEQADRARRAWSVARPEISGLAGGFSVPIAIHGCRGAERESLDWLEFLLGLLPEQSPQRETALLMRGDALLHQGRWAEAADLLAPQLGRWSFFALFYRAVRAEAFVRAERGNDRDLAGLESASFEHPYARATALRARALLEGDRALLGEALEIFERIECPYQRARTGWLLGGEQRAAAEAVFSRLRVTPPAD